MIQENDSATVVLMAKIGSVHHLLKIVNGTPLRRPAWYYDVSVQGNGLVDITSHMIDQAMWLLPVRTVSHFDPPVCFCAISALVLCAVQQWRGAAV